MRRKSLSFATLRSSEFKCKANANTGSKKVQTDKPHSGPLRPQWLDRSFRIPRRKVVPSVETL